MSRSFCNAIGLVLVLGILLGTTCLAAEKFIKVDKYDDFELEIGAVLPQKFLKKNKASQKIRITGAQTVPGYNVRSNDIEYQIGVDENNAIIYIGTADPNFVTPERIKPGMNVGDAIKSSPNGAVVLERGWIGYIPFKSGWNAAIILDNRDQWSYFDKVAFVFKRK